MAKKYILVEARDPEADDPPGDEFPEEVLTKLRDQPRDDWVVATVRRVADILDVVGTSGETIDTLDLVGHGNPKLMNVGASFTPSENGRQITSALTTFQLLWNLKGRLRGHSKIRFLGCQTGVRASIGGDLVIDGRAMLFAVASLLQCEVLGTPANIKPAQFATGEFVSGSADDWFVRAAPDHMDPARAPQVDQGPGGDPTPDQQDLLHALEASTTTIMGGLPPSAFLRGFKLDSIHTKEARGAAAPLARIVVTHLDGTAPGPVTLSLCGAVNLLRVTHLHGSKRQTLWLRRAPSSVPIDTAAWVPRILSGLE